MFKEVISWSEEFSPFLGRLSLPTLFVLVLCVQSASVGAYARARPQAPVQTHVAVAANAPTITSHLVNLSKAKSWVVRARVIRSSFLELVGTISARRHGIDARPGRSKRFWVSAIRTREYQAVRPLQ